MKLRVLALPVLAVGLVLGGCSGHGHHDRHNSSGHSQTQHSDINSGTEPASMPDGNSNSAGPKYPSTGGSR